MTRMNRLLGWLLICSGVVLSASCGCGVGNLQPVGRSLDNGRVVYPGDTVETADYAELYGTTPVDPKMARLLKWPVLKASGQLPPLPLASALGRLPSELSQREHTGDDAYDWSGNASQGTGTMQLAADPSGISWAIYELADIGLYDQLQRLYVETSAGVFSGEDPGYWVGFANYDEDSWEVKALTQVADYQRSIGLTAPYVSSQGRVYVFILVASGQSLTVNRVALDVDHPTWVEFTADEGPDAGWMPAIAFTQTGNPLAVYIDDEFNKPRWVIGDRTQDLREEDSWTIGSVDAQPEGEPAWPDVVIDPVTGNPRVSLCYHEIVGQSNNSRIGLSVMLSLGGNPFYLNYGLSYVDGAVYSSVDRHPVTGAYGIASTALNLNTAGKGTDLNYHVFQINDPGNIADDDPYTYVANYSELFGQSSFEYPHLRYHPTGGNATLCINGGYVYFENTLEDWWLPSEFSDSGDIGSVAYSPIDSLIGHSFNRTGEFSGELLFIESSASTPGSQEQVASIARSIGTEFIGGASQLAYMADGTPAIAYTESDGFYTDVKYAYLNGSGWLTEHVSNDPMPVSAPEEVLVDLAFDSGDVAAVCYNRVAGSVCSLRVAMRGL